MWCPTEPEESAKPEELKNTVELEQEKAPNELREQEEPRADVQDDESIQGEVHQDTADNPPSGVASFSTVEED